jgi:serine/threonine-protein kinase
VIPLERGTIIADRYRVGGVLAETDLGVLLEARHVQLDDSVIVKVLSDRVHDARLAAKFVREARNAARVKNDHVARFMDVGTLPDGRPYVVMEHLDGEDAESMMKRGAVVSVAEAVDWIVQACDALATAHAIGIVHRDLRPSSFFLARTRSRHRTLKLMNFGTSRVSDSLGSTEDQGLTVAGLSTGSPDYTAPEVFLRADAEPRADVWSLGAVLYELLTGQRPFGGQPDQAIKRILSEAPVAPTTLRPELPGALERVVLRCLEKRPADRFGSVGELGTALAPFASRAGAALAAQIGGGSSISIRPSTNLPIIDTEVRGPEEAILHRRMPSGGMEKISTDELHLPRPEPSPRRRWPVPVVIAGLAGLAAATIVGARSISRAGTETAAQSPTQGATIAGSAASTAPPAVSSPARADALPAATPASSPRPTLRAPAPAPAPASASASASASATLAPSTPARVSAGAPAPHRPRKRRLTPHPGAPSSWATDAPPTTRNEEDPWGWKR